MCSTPEILHTELAMWQGYLMLLAFVELSMMLTGICIIERSTQIQIITQLRGLAR